MTNSFDQFHYSKEQIDSISNLLSQIPLEQLIQCELLQNKTDATIKYFSDQICEKTEEKSNFGMKMEKPVISQQTQEKVPEQNPVQQNKAEENLDSWLDGLLG